MRKVAHTSISAFHDPEVQASIGSQRERVAARVISETRAGRPSCIGSIWDHFNKVGDKALSQKSSVSRACNEIAELGIIEFGGRQYRFERVADRKHGGHMAKHFCLVLVNASPDGVQKTLFDSGMIEAGLAKEI